MVVCDVPVMLVQTLMTFPVQPKQYSPQFLRSVPHLRARHPALSILLTARSILIQCMTSAMWSEKFIQVHTPIITSSDCEGAGEVFTVTTSKNESPGPRDHFFREPKYLTVSAQLHLEALAGALERVWTLSPTFRAEKSDTSRHLSEFYMLEAEMAFTKDLDDVMHIVEKTIRSSVKELLNLGFDRSLSERAKSHIPSDNQEQVDPDTLRRRWEGIIKSGWPRETYDRAIEILKEAQAEGHKFEHEICWEKGLNAEHEKFLAAKIGDGSPVFITDYPREQKPFYMTSTPGSNGRTAACFDLLVPDLCEIAGGSIREHRLDSLVQKMQEKGLIDPSLYQKAEESADEQAAIPENSLDWYMDLRIYGSVPHGGYVRSDKASSTTTNLDQRFTPGVGQMAAHDKLIIEEEDYEYEGLPPNFSLAANMAAGAFAGVAEHTVMYPIDLLKTRMQVINASTVYTGIGNAISTVSRAEGYLSLWRGISSVILGAGPAHAVYFATYEVVKQAMGGNAAGHHPLAAATSGACATIASDAFMNPFDVIKQRMQVHGSTYRSVTHCARDVFRNEGLRAFYVSYPTTLTMTVPFTAIQFTAYESISKLVRRRQGYDPLTHCLAGGLAGGIAAAVTTPLDVIKTLLQTKGNSTDREIRGAKGLFNAAGIIARREGAKGFFRGMNARVVTAAPSTAICWSAYEVAKAYFVAREEAK
ncbi:hypothetical protein KVT40_002034 [Elsinoe batatas]|uniref:Aminoacyl-transfer RNA synthetases class-II family profile domain-containing protein n=1 Tax=Elsinoe batatas TaxID=2601811 RepID=A0A8K0LAA5_9PEZI|nr:hypothetical protein KVT40_002034 [Elsinoe batatas]